MISNGYRVNEKDECIYYKYENNICTIIHLYVDNLFIFDSNIHVENVVKSLLSSNFSMKDLGEADVILDFMITTSEKRISLTMFNRS